MIRVTIDYANELPIAVHDDSGTLTYDQLNITDREGNTVAQLTINTEGLVTIQIKGNAYPSTAIQSTTGGIRPHKRRKKPCGCLGG